jgi:ParB-like chromosome segregation protein Spo0J
MKPKPIAIDLIRIDAGTQFRAAINQDRVTDYADLFDASKEWPFDSACEVYFDGVEYYLVDGFHRYHAAKRVKRASLSCVVHSGTQRDAIKFALSANARHGLHRSNEDKRKAVAFVLEDAEWSNLSSVAIAEICGVSHKFVGNVRKEAGLYGTNVTGKDGKEYPATKPKADPKPEPKDEPEEEEDVPTYAQTQDHWEDVDDTPSKPEQEAKPEPSAKERAASLKSIIKQHNAAMMRAIDDLNGMLPNKLCHDMAHKSFRAIHEVVEAWR